MYAKLASHSLAPTPARVDARDCGTSFEKVADSKASDLTDMFVIWNCNCLQVSCQEAELRQSDGYSENSARNSGNIFTAGQSILPKLSTEVVSASGKGEVSGPNVLKMLTLPLLVWHLVQWPLSKMFVVIRKYESCLVPSLHLCFVCILHWFPSFKDSPDDDAFFEEGKPLHCTTEIAFPPAEFWTTNTTFYLYPFILYVSIMLILCLNASFSCFDFCCIFLCQQLRTRRVEWATSPASVEKKRVELNMRLTLVTPLISLLFIYWIVIRW